MQLNLTAEEEAFIEAKLADGFESRESVVAAALELLRKNDAEYSTWLRQQVEVGVRDADAGRIFDFTTEDLLSYLESDPDGRRSWRERQPR
jgi:hypothetical protein